MCHSVFPLKSEREALVIDSKKKLFVSSYIPEKSHQTWSSSGKCAGGADSKVFV